MNYQNEAIVIEHQLRMFFPGENIADDIRNDPYDTIGHYLYKVAADHYLDKSAIREFLTKYSAIQGLKLDEVSDYDLDYQSFICDFRRLVS